MSTTFVTLFFVFGVPAAMIVLLAWINSRKRVSRYELEADLYAKALERGEKLPDDLFDRSYSIRIERERRETEKEELSDLKRNALNVGIILMFAGFGVALVLWIVAFVIGQTDGINAQILVIIKAVSAVGIIPFLIGVAFMIIHFIEKKKAH
ncbi:MAG: DUF6249 domain-containing protein [Bacteroidales bacterium]|jgi:ABC-type multidrug transport system fused ATPase/permease subunit|nr:DUF6249 domain-containing protein [Bacteroidales bacterium]